MTSTKVRNLSSLTWSIADLLRGDFKQSEYGKVILPIVVLRRLDCILEETKDAVLAAAGALPEAVDEATKDMILFDAAGGLKAYNLSPFTFAKLKGQNPSQLHANLLDYITKFSAGVRDIFLDKFLFTDQLKRLKDADLLWPVFEKMTEIDLHPNVISNVEMGYLFEDLIRRFSEISNETAGEHFTPREVVRLIVEMLLANDREALTGSGVIRTVYDPACGTGGMLAITEEQLKKLNPRIRVELYGQELNPESFAICKSDMLITGHDPEQIAFGNTLTSDAHKGKTFHYMISNPPYGVDWKKYADVIREEHETLGVDGRFGAGLPRVSDGQMLFVQHMISKMRNDEVGSQIGIVMNASPLFTGGAASGESEIRRWLIENDWVEAIVALPTEIFYNTGIPTYVWLVSNRKAPSRRGKVQLIDASSDRFWCQMRRGLGLKRREIPDHARKEIVAIYADALEGGSSESEHSRVLDVADFGYREIRVDRPLRLAFQATPSRIENLRRSKPFLKLSEEQRSDILAVVEGTLPTAKFMRRDEFDAALSRAAKSAGIKLAAPVRKLIRNALSERDQNAQVCFDNSGNPEHDPQLRDFEIVPFKEDMAAFFEREVRPIFKDAWIDKTYVDAVDGKVGRVGYEINFNRYFYRFIAPRPLNEIDAELKELERNISLLNEQRASAIAQIVSNSTIAHEMAQTGIDAIPVAPKHWKMMRLAALFRESSEANQPLLPVLSITIADGISDKELTNEERVRSVSRSEDLSAYKVVRPGDLAYNMMRAWQGALGVASVSGIVSPAYVVARPIVDLHAGYFEAVLRTPMFIEEMRRASRGIADFRQRLYWQDFRQIRIPVPPLEEQASIARAVGELSQRLSAATAPLRRSIALLQERRAALITSFVTGVLTADAKVDSARDKGMAA